MCERKKNNQFFFLIFPIAQVLSSASHTKDFPKIAC